MLVNNFRMPVSFGIWFSWDFWRASYKQHRMSKLLYWMLRDDWWRTILIIRLEQWKRITLAVLRAMSMSSGDQHCRRISRWKLSSIHSSPQLHSLAPMCVWSAFNFSVRHRFEHRTPPVSLLCFGFANVSGGHLNKGVIRVRFGLRSLSRRCVASSDRLHDEPQTVIDPAGASVTLRSGDALLGNLTGVTGVEALTCTDSWLTSSSMNLLSTFLHISLTYSHM